MLDKQLIDKILTEALSTGGDFAEIFVEKKSSSNLFMIDGKVESSISGRDFGIGIRIFKDLYSVYGYTNDMTEENRKLKLIIFPGETVVIDEYGKRIVACPTEDEAEEYIREQEE